MDKRAELMAKEEQGWNRLHELAGHLSPEEMEVGGLNAEGWSAKDLLWHLGCWAAEAGKQLERIRLGTYAEEKLETDGLNARFLEEGRRQDLATVKSELSSARNRALQEWGALEEITPEAEEWFYESGTEHYEDHLDELRAWVSELESRRG